jgi:hypothetical protein
MPLEDYGQFRLIAPSRIDSLEDALEELRADATAELYKDAPDELWQNFSHSLNSVYRMQRILSALQGELHAAFETHRGE